MAEIEWLDDPDEHDFDAARDFLRLLADPSVVQDFILQFGWDFLYRYHPATREQFKVDVAQVRKAKDLLRAVGDDGNPLSALLPEHNRQVAKDIRKIKAGEALSPVLLVVDTQRARLIIADGHHRVCACYHYDESALVHARLIYW